MARLDHARLREVRRSERAVNARVGPADARKGGAVVRNLVLLRRRVDAFPVDIIEVDVPHGGVHFLDEGRAFGVPHGRVERGQVARRADVVLERLRNERRPEQVECVVELALPT